MTGAEMLRQQGMQQGEQRKQHEIAKNMLADNEPLEKVSRFTGLSKDVLAKLKKNLDIG